jgi:hypothetical protein
MTWVATKILTVVTHFFVHYDSKVMLDSII